MIPTILYLFLLLLGLIAGYIVASRVAAWRLRSQELVWRERVESRVAEDIRAREAEVRRDAAARSGRVLSSGVLEKFSPLASDFPFDPHDAVWIGHPVDFVVFDGLSKDRNDASALNRIVLVEVKSGAGKLSRRQRQVRDVVESGRVEWLEYRIPGQD